MSSRAKVLTTVILLFLLSGLGFADYYLSAPVEDTTTATQTSSSVATSQTGTPSGGVRPQNGPDIATTIADAGFTTGDTNDLSFLAQIAGSGSEIHALAILKNGDRAGSVTWIESGKVKNYFIALKEALLSSFSSKMQDLRDETIQTPNAPVRNELTFLDPNLSTERLMFVRVRERLYEFHIANGKEDVMNGLIETLTTK